MTTYEIAERFKAKSSGKGFVARCPAHDDRHPSLAIAEGRDGRTLLRCFKGCEVEAVARAAGLSINDLFVGAPAPIRRGPGRPTAAELYVALAREERELRERHGIEGLLRTNEINRIRSTIAQRYGIVLEGFARPLYQGGFGGRDRDVAWPAIFDWAIGVASATLLGTALAFNETLPPPRGVLIEAEELTAAAMRDLEREARERPSIAA